MFLHRVNLIPFVDDAVSRESIKLTRINVASKVVPMSFTRLNRLLDLFNCELNFRVYIHNPSMKRGRIILPWGAIY